MELLEFVRLAVAGIDFEMACFDRAEAGSGRQELTDEGTDASFRIDRSSGSCTDLQSRLGVDEAWATGSG